MTRILELPRKGRGGGDWTVGVLIVIGLTLIASWGKAALESRAYQSREGSRLERMLLAWTLGAKTAQASMTREEARTSGLVGRLEIPRIGLSTMVAEGVHPRTLSRAVGHVPRTAFPGENGNVGLAGHRDTHLRKLRRIRRGDVIHMRTPDGTFVYRVDETRIVRPNRVDVLEPGEDPKLTLVTCYPFRAIGPAPLRFVVSASQTSAAAAPQVARADKGATGSAPARAAKAANR